MGFKSSLTQILTIIAAVLLVGCGTTQPTEPPIAKAPDISILEAVEIENTEAVKQNLDAGADVNAFDLGVKDGPDSLLEGIKKSAFEGNADAQCLLAAIHNRGDGVPKNLAKAAKLYLLAAEQGHDKAQLKLGYCYKDGLGVPQDKTKAYVWFSISANNGGALNGRGRAGELADEISVLLPNNEIGEAKAEIKRLEKLISAREKENYLHILNQINKAGWMVEMEKAEDGSHNVRATKYGMTSKSMAPNWRVAFINVLQQCEKWPE